MKIDAPGIDGEKLEQEIEAEAAACSAGISAPPTALPGPEEEDSAALIEIAGAYSSGWDIETLGRRRKLLKPFLPLISKILGRLMKPQYIFNSLVLEVLQRQEERLARLERGGDRDGKF
jgi:hypothetical protein